jgi:hypothetical protein
MVSKKVYKYDPWNQQERKKFLLKKKNPQVCFFLLFLFAQFYKTFWGCNLPLGALSKTA